jgi:hypothetical protein
MGLISYKLGQTSVILRVLIQDSSSTTGAGLTGLEFDSTGLRIATIVDNSPDSVAYTAAGSTIEAVDGGVLGTYVAPTSTKCRFYEVDSTNHPGVYELQFADARFAVSNAKSLLISITGATNAVPCHAVIPLVRDDPYLTPPTAANNAQAVWEYDISGAFDAGAAGLILAETYTQTLNIASQVWDALVASYNVANSFGEVLNDAATAGEIADAVWDEATSGHATAGTTGLAVATASSSDATAANQTLILAQVNKITTGRVNVISHVHANDVVINQGETYSSTLNPLTFTFASGDSWPTDLTSYTITLIATQTHDTTGATPTSPATISQTGSVATATGDSRAVRVGFTAAQSAALTPGLYEYYLKASTGSGGSTVDWLRQGQLRVIDATP